MVVGAINWLLVGLFKFNLVAAIFGVGLVADIVYVIVGLAGLFGIWMLATLGSRRDDVCVPRHHGVAVS